MAKLSEVCDSSGGAPCYAGSEQNRGIELPEADE